jgi:hypothetical protein
VLKVKVPLDRAIVSIAAPVEAFLRTTKPVGVLPEPVTEPLNAALESTVMGKVVLLARVTAVAFRAGDAQLASRFVTFTVPSPVAKS